MLKLIIVDDERATREKLMDNIEWQRLRIEVAGEAKDGAEGLRLYERIRPDIVLLDVRMPRMNGIECAAAIRRLDAGGKIIFLSGYTDKQYLKSAIQMQAIDYIEKPIDLDDLYSVLKKTVLLCEDEAARKARQQDIDARIEQSLVWMKQELALDMIRHDAEPAAIKRRFEELGTPLPLNDNYRCILLEFGAPRERGGDTAAALPKEKLLDMMNSRFESASNTCVAGMLDGSRAVAIVYGKAAEHSTVLREAVHGVQDDYRALSPGGSRAVTAAIGRSVRGMEHVPHSFEQACQALQKKFIRGCGSLLLAEEDDGALLDAHAADDINDRLRRYLQEGDLASARRDVAQLADRFRQQADRLRISSIKAELLAIMLHLAQLAKEHGLAPGGGRQDREMQWAELLNEGTLPETVDFILERLELLFGQAGELRGKSRKIRSAMAYIKERYGDDLSVAMLADHLEMGTSYLSTLFKKETGKTLSEYIESFRMEKAKELLRDERLKMNDVASSVGYRNANYFATVFKRATGCYPSEYRRNQLR